MKLIYPMLAQIAWVFVVMIMMVKARFDSVSKREVKIGQIALGNDAWPDKVKAISNNFTNQFETPVLFFAISGLAIYLGETGWLMAGLAWVYVATRVVHTFVHAGSNHIPTRFRVFGASIAILLVMFILVALKAIAG